MCRVICPRSHLIPILIRTYILISPPSPPLTLLPNIPHQPIHTLLDTPPIHRTTSHNTPIPIFELPQLERLADLARALGTRLILFVCEDEEGGVAQLFFVEHGAQFFAGGGQALDVCAVDYEDYGGGVGVVAAPVGADGGLAAEVLGVGC